SARRDENAERRGVFSFLGRYALKSLNFGVKVTTKLVPAVDLAVTITQAIKGCGAFYPKLDKNWKKYAALDADFRRISADIETQNNQAISRQIYANSSFYEYRITRKKMQLIADEQERVFKSLGPEALVALQNNYSKMKKYAKKYKDAKRDVKRITVDRKFMSGMELAMNLILPATTLAWPGVQKVWKSIKGTVVGRKINQIQRSIGTIFQSSTQRVSRSTARRITTSKFMNSSFARKIQNLIARAQSKFRSAGKLIAKVKLGLGPALKLGVAAFGVWSIYIKIRNCKKAADDSDGSVKKMREFVELNKNLLKNMTIANKKIQQVYDEIRNASWDSRLLTSMESIKEMMSDPQVAKKTEDSDSIVTAFQNYINGKDIDATNDRNKKILSNLQTELNAALHRVPFTLRCHRFKGETLQAVKSECTSGNSGTLQQVYEKVKRLKGIAESTGRRCAFKTGELYVSFGSIKSAWEKWVSTKKTYKAPCLMNNKFIVESIREQLQNGERDVNTIAQSVNQPDGVEEIQIIIDELLKDPSINDLPKSRQKHICQFKRYVDAGQMTVEVALLSVNVGKKRKVTKEEFKNQTCPVPKDDDYLSKNINGKQSLREVDYF
ncbi:hypothetical protein QZH41_009988, partial [Actinostola sp. cb2023]